MAIAHDSGLENAYWSGHVDLPGVIMKSEREIMMQYVSEEALLAGSYALHAGCKTHPRSCSTCSLNQECSIKQYTPKIVT